jgi:bacterioferritin (cytochrome b1)
VEKKTKMLSFVICVSGFLAVSLLLLLTATAGDPTVKVKDAEYSQDSKRMLEISLKQVQVTIKHYRERIRQAERSGEFALSEVLRDIIAQELNRLRNRSERCPQIMMIIDRLGINQCIPVVRADNCSCC